MDIEKLVERQRAFFRENKTKELKFRPQALKRLEDAIVNNEEDLKAALKEDLNKSSMESYMTEIGLTLSEIRYVRKNLSRWDQDEKVVTPLAQFHAKSFVRREPYGVVLAMAPWNYPGYALPEPLIGAIAAGNSPYFETFCLCPRGVGRTEPADPAGLSFPLCVCGRRGKRGEYPASGTEIRLHFLYRRCTGGKTGDEKSRREPDSGDAGTGRKEPLYCG